MRTSHEKANQREGGEIRAEGCRDPRHHHDPIGGHERPEPAHVVGRIPEEQRPYDPAREEDGLSKGRLPRVIADPIHLKGSNKYQLYIYVHY